MDSTICHFEIPADDLKATASFYRELFGWSTADAGQEDQYLFVKTSQRPDGLGGALIRRAEGQQGVTLYVLVESLDESVKRLEELGGVVTAPRSPLRGVGWIATARDPNGNLIGLFEVDGGAA